MDRRSQILTAVRRQQVEPTALPEITGPWTVYSDPIQQFIDVLQSVGGRAIRVRNPSELLSQVSALPEYRNAKTRYCSLQLAGEWNVDLQQIEDPHELADLEFAMLGGSMAVAENGAVWVSDQGLRHRVVYFIVQHLALVVPTSAVVHHLHEAYARLESADDRELAARRFGCFISGPSKTADIEQSLVIGAHGPRSLTVFLQQDG
jgi:L-lactate dehydrogenase complex protein LldG